LSSPVFFWVFFNIPVSFSSIVFLKSQEIYLFLLAVLDFLFLLLLLFISDSWCILRIGKGFCSGY